MLTKNSQYPQGITGLTIIINFQTQENGVVKVRLENDLQIIH